MENFTVGEFFATRYSAYLGAPYTSQRREFTIYDECDRDDFARITLHAQVENLGYDENGMLFLPERVKQDYSWWNDGRSDNPSMPTYRIHIEAGSTVISKELLLNMVINNQMIPLDIIVARPWMKYQLGPKYSRPGDFSGPRDFTGPRGNKVPAVYNASLGGSGSRFYSDKHLADLRDAKWEPSDMNRPSLVAFAFPADTVTLGDRFYMHSLDDPRFEGLPKKTLCWEGTYYGDSGNKVEGSSPLGPYAYPGLRMARNGLAPIRTDLTPDSLGF